MFSFATLGGMPSLKCHNGKEHQHTQTLKLLALLPASARPPHEVSLGQ